MLPTKLSYFTLETREICIRKADGDRKERTTEKASFGYCGGTRTAARGKEMPSSCAVHVAAPSVGDLASLTILSLESTAGGSGNAIEWRARWLLLTRPAGWALSSHVGLLPVQVQVLRVLVLVCMCSAHKSTRHTAYGSVRFPLSRVRYIAHPTGFCAQQPYYDDDGRLNSASSSFTSVQMVDKRVPRPHWNDG